jgi:hypothetical protein
MIHELRDLAEAGRYLLEGLWLQRAAAPTAATVRPALEWSLELASAGHPLPPTGFVADVGHAVFHPGGAVRQASESATGHGLPAGLARTYEDHVLGKLYADYHFERAGDALRRYQGRDRARGLAFVVNQFRERAGFAGVFLSPAILRGLLELPPEEALARGWETLGRNGLLPLLPELYTDLISASRRIAEVLGPEDVFELEHGTALLELGQRVALRQVLQTTDRLEGALPTQQVRAPAGRHAVPTRILDEDTYPVGGYSSVSTRGSIESLLHSQLAFMEPDEADQRPDMFDIKFIRDELLYYSRDENQFLRRRRAFVFGLSADLVRARFKDAELPVQRVVLLLAVSVAVVRKISEWLSTDALVFTVAVIDGGDTAILADEMGLLATIFREAIANGTVRLERRPKWSDLAEECGRQSRRSMCHCLLLAIDPPRIFEADDTVVSRLAVNGPTPILELPVEFDSPATGDADGPLQSWAAVLERLLRAWS